MKRKTKSKPRMTRQQIRDETAGLKAFGQRRLVGRKHSAAPELPPQKKVDPRMAAAIARGRALLQKMKRAVAVGGTTSRGVHRDQSNSARQTGGAVLLPARHGGAVDQGRQERG